MGFLQNIDAHHLHKDRSNDEKIGLLPSTPWLSSGGEDDSFAKLQLR